MYRRRNSYRLKYFDYTSHGAYFITITAKNHQRIFSKIINSAQTTEKSSSGSPKNTVGHKLSNSAKAEIAKKSSSGSPKSIVGHKHTKSTKAEIAKKVEIPPSGNVRVELASTLKPKTILTPLGQILSEEWLNLPNYFKNIFIDEFVIMPNHIHGIIFIQNHFDKAEINLSQIIQSLKSRTSTRYLKYVKENNLGKMGQIWKRSYYDRVIRDEDALYEIRTYIRFNPMKWLIDDK